MVNIEELKSHYGDDAEMIIEILSLFEAHYLDTLNALKKSILSENVKNTALHAHTLKGMISNFFAIELKELAFKIEQTANNGSLENTQESVERLESGLPEMIRFIKDKMEML